MRQYLFPVVFFQDESSGYVAFAPDLNLTSDGETIEEAYLFIQDFIRVYCGYAIKSGEEESLIPTKYEKIVENNPSKLVMLVDAFV